MRHRRRLAMTANSPPRPGLEDSSSLWRWSIGGPIIDFGQEGDAGPSKPPAYSSDPLSTTAPMAVHKTRRRVDQLHLSHDHISGAEEYSRPPQSTHCPHDSPARPSRRAILTSALAVSLMLHPLAAAGPLPASATSSIGTTQPTLSSQIPSTTLVPSTPPTPTSFIPPDRTLAPRRVNTAPDYLWPSNVPTTLTNVPETVLPYYFTQSSDGLWYKVDSAWIMYGRAAGSLDGDHLDVPLTDLASSTASPVSYAVTSVLPSGWGDPNSDRLSFYNISLIAVAAVVLAFSVVGMIIFITLKRRKINRRKKRHEARMRKKALAAAGLTQDQLNDADSVMNAQYQQHLGQIERAHHAKRKSQRPSTFVRTKVRVWQHGEGLRRRGKSRRDEHGDSGEGNGDAHSVHATGLTSRPRRLSDDSLLTDESSLASTVASSHSNRSRTGRPDESSPHSAVDAEPPTSDTLVSDGNSATLSSSVSPSQEQHAESEASRSPEALQPQGESSSSAIGPPADGPSMPPAYRPASVHQNDIAGQHRPHSPEAQVVTTREKVAAAGYYPAPATADAENAQRIAYSADAKRPIVPSPDDEEGQQRAMHIATDDKRELERLRLGASAPPVHRAPEEDSDASPSAPTIEIDSSGFEVVPVDENGASSSSRSRAIVGIPTPPPQHSYRSVIPQETDELHLVPSAPPPSQLQNDGEGPFPHAPSAPPLDVPSAPPADFDDDGDDGGYGFTPTAPDDARPAGSAPSAPSAPILDESELLYDDTYVDEAPAHTAISGEASGVASGWEHHPLDTGEDDTHASTAGQSSSEAEASGRGEQDDRRSLGVSGLRYLPVYEP